MAQQPKSIKKEDIEETVYFDENFEMVTDPKKAAIVRFKLKNGTVIYGVPSDD